MLSILLTVAVAGAPPAVDAGPPAVDVPVSFQQWASAEVQRLDAAACRCGASCECVDCECPGCPHKGNSKATLNSSPHLVATLWQSGCVHGENWYANAYPELLAKGWRIEVRRVPSDSGVACPTFTMGSRTWSGYTGKASHFAALRPAESVRVTHDAQRHEAAKPVQTLSPPSMVMRGDYHVHVCRRCGHSWSHHDSNSGNAAAHRCAACGNYEYRISSHSGLAPASSPRATYQMQSGGCPGGVCPPRSGGLFGFGLFR